MVSGDVEMKEATLPVKMEVKSEDEDSDSGELENEDEVVAEFDVVMAAEGTRSSPGWLYRVQLPTRKFDTFTPNTDPPRARFKKNVKMLELRMDLDTSTGAFDRRRAEELNMLKEPKFYGNVRAEEKFDGRAYSEPDKPVFYAVGYYKNEKLYVAPIVGHFEMHQQKTVNESKTKHGAADVTDDSTGDESMESEPEQQTSSKRVRVKFVRPETERQKKRREASALHRGKLVAQDEWINMSVLLGDEKALATRREVFLTTKVKNEPSTNGTLEQETGFDSTRVMLEHILGVEQASKSSTMEIIN